MKKKSSLKSFKNMKAEDKLLLVSQMPEVANAVKILYGLFKDTKAKSFIRYGYEIEGKSFELIFQEVKTSIMK